MYMLENLILLVIALHKGYMSIFVALELLNKSNIVDEDLLENAQDEFLKKLENLVINNVDIDLQKYELVVDRIFALDGLERIQAMHCDVDKKLQKIEQC